MHRGKVECYIPVIGALCMKPDVTAVKTSQETTEEEPVAHDWGAHGRPVTGTGEPPAVKRHEWILTTVERNGFIRTAEIIEQFGVSRMTAHRDLSSMSEEGLIERRRGGAVAVAPSASGHSEHDRTAGCPPGAVRRRIGWLTPCVGYHYRTLIRGAVESRIVV